MWLRVGTWSHTAEEDWKALADAVGVFHLEHGRWPTIRTTAQPEERRLGLWLSTQRRRAARDAVKFTEEHRSYLDRAAPGWSLRTAGASAHS